MAINYILFGRHIRAQKRISAHAEHEAEEMKRDREVSELITSAVHQEIVATLPSLKLHATPQQTYPPTRHHPHPKRILVTGGAGFVGSNLVDVLMTQGHYVYVLDNLFTGRRRNIEHWLGHPQFEFFQADVTQPFFIECDQIYHLACPASPPHYQFNPIKTLKTSTHGTLNMLGLAKRVQARLLLASTSEIYGDPLVHPQPEDYWGNVNTMGPRSCYDEGKRAAETLCYCYRHQNDVDVRIARIFNTFGPRMEPNDGRVVSNFIKFALKAAEDSPIQIYGDGTQTRSFQYVSDLISGLLLLMNSDELRPVNLGNPVEYSITEWATIIRDKINPAVPIEYTEAATDDPKKRKPDITRARTVLGWSPVVPAVDGVDTTIEYFKQVLGLADGPVHTPKVWMPFIPDPDPSPPARGIPRVR